MAIPGQRLSQFADIWKEAGADPALQTLIREGHKIVFEDGPPPCTLPSKELETKLSEEKMVVIRDEVDTLLGKGAIHKVSPEEAISTPGHYSFRFLWCQNPEANGGL